MQVAVSAGAAVAAFAVATLAADRYRAGRDPHALFLTTGWTVVAVQALLFGVWWPIHYGTEAALTALGGIPTPTPMLSFSGLAPVYAFQFGWLLAGCCFFLGTPWWDRRGRDPIRWWLVVATVTAVVLLVDRYLAASYRRLPGPGAFVSTIAFRERAHVETTGWILG